MMRLQDELNSFVSKLILQQLLLHVPSMEESQVYW